MTWQRIESNRYQFAHGREPRGFGLWAFEVTERVERADGFVTETRTVFTPRPMSFRDAKHWVRHQVRGSRSVCKVEVGS